MTAEPDTPGRLLTPAQVAAIVFVDPKTVSRWARAGKIPSTRTAGGHRRFLSSDVDAFMRADHLPDRRQPASVTPLYGTAREGDMEPGLDDAVTRAAAVAMVSEAIAIALEAQADTATEAVTERAAAVVVAAATAAVATVRARDARAVAAAEAAFAHDVARRDSERPAGTSLGRGVTR